VRLCIHRHTGGWLFRVGDRCGAYLFVAARHWWLRYVGSYRSLGADRYEARACISGGRRPRAHRRSKPGTGSPDVLGARGRGPAGRDYSPTTTCSLAAKAGSWDGLKAPHPCGWRRCAARIALHRAQRLPDGRGRPAGQCVISPGGLVSVSSTMRSTSAGANGGRLGFLVLSGCRRLRA
jgi:hypothetical protein